MDAMPEWLVFLQADSEEPLAFCAGKRYDQAWLEKHYFGRSAEGIRKGRGWKLGDHSETLQLSSGKQCGLELGQAPGLETGASGGGCGRGRLWPTCP